MARMAWRTRALLLAVPLLLCSWAMVRGSKSEGAWLYASSADIAMSATIKTSIDLEMQDENSSCSCT
jgi:hypothetical protein